MRPEDRQQMIRTMVDGLAARLEQNPDDVAGWQRLARAWRVLGEKQKAEEALGRVASLRPNDAEAQLEHARAMLDADGGAPDPKKPLPQKFIAAFERVAQLDPKNQDALWYLGLAAAQRQDKAKATQLWNELLAMLPPGGDDHRTVKEALEALGAK
jgi:cytochrome c-type biogenesis protein CcmH